MTKPTFSMSDTFPESFPFQTLFFQAAEDWYNKHYLHFTPDTLSSDFNGIPASELIGFLEFVNHLEDIDRTGLSPYVLDKSNVLYQRYATHYRELNVSEMYFASKPFHPRIETLARRLEVFVTVVELSLRYLAMEDYRLDDSIHRQPGYPERHGEHAITEDGGSFLIAMFDHNFLKRLDANLASESQIGLVQVVMEAFMRDVKDWVMMVFRPDCKTIYEAVPEGEWGNFRSKCRWNLNLVKFLTGLRSESVEARIWRHLNKTD
ncbi:hypothetical protein BJ508DRAFT_363467 [Ascobolus immersus RN42]|uniref:Uncharacterized protein n=1 Tax=Ascobolus immersus RN42 TaxID=1160509 RepID=A0A3N4HYS4_ASCIM|nr:hypothetical protein BJ508DRAFT_363467 [Ascobolus immersus RN42]